MDTYEKEVSLFNQWNTHKYKLPREIEAFRRRWLKRIERLRLTSCIHYFK